jgi:hypothetical protein
MYHTRQAALFAGVQAQLIASIPANQPPTSLLKALSFFSYGGLVLNIGAALSSMSLIDSLGHIPEEFWRSGAKPRPTAEPENDVDKPSDFDLLKSHGGSSSIGQNYMHCQILLIFGAYCLLLQIALLAWSKSTSSIVSAFITVCLFWVCLVYPGQIIFSILRGIIAGLRG